MCRGVGSHGAPQATASSASETTPTARGGSKSNGGSGKPVTPVRTVVARNKAVQKAIDLPVSVP